MQQQQDSQQREFSCSMPAPRDLGGAVSAIVDSLVCSGILLSFRDLVSYGLAMVSTLIMLIYVFPLQLLFIVLVVIFVLFSLIYIAVSRRTIGQNCAIDARRFREFKQRQEQAFAAAHNNQAAAAAATAVGPTVEVVTPLISANTVASALPPKIPPPTASTQTE